MASVSGSDSSGAKRPMAPRPLVPADVDGVVAIERAAFTDPWPRRAFEELLAERHVRSLAIDDAGGRLVGYALCSVAADEGEILNLAVDPTARRRGYARRLLGAALDLMRQEGVTGIFLEVRQSNAAAIRLYSGAGFRSVSVRRGYYRNPTEHALTMALKLAPEGAEKR
jgi:ribosomal-protein-alanine N-acetyltransferase